MREAEAHFFLWHRTLSRQVGCSSGGLVLKLPNQCGRARGRIGESEPGACCGGTGRGLNDRLQQGKGTGGSANGPGSWDGDRFREEVGRSPSCPSEVERAVQEAVAALRADQAEDIPKRLNRFFTDVTEPVPQDGRTDAMTMAWEDRAVNGPTRSELVFQSVAIAGDRASVRFRESLGVQNPGTSRAMALIMPGNW